MQIKYYNDLDKFPYIIIDDVYNQWELKEIWEELDFLCHPRRLMPATIDNGAATEEGKILKFNHCQYLDNVYIDRQFSSILQITEKIFMNDRKIFSDHPHWCFGDIQTIDQHYTQVVYYEDKDEYKSHKDKSIFTCLTWFYRRPKRYKGGDIWFQDFNTGVECLNNRTLIFPSIIRHAVKPVKMEEQHKGQKYGRFCISQFMSTKF
ncbi:hypothetical protein CMO86_09475 [Candidatus Woesearchaeota archaeon]|nr:hypothetical protein [Candidatus Woesearchaeota archaeon]|tara:strand:+ start:248 stop:865 length:618 start_codon:yes stop_codon:yes gene_type:complete